MVDEALRRRLREAAFAAQEQAYVPYSGFKVGAALAAEDGRIYRGCNIENAAYSVANCAERTALFKAVSQGQQDFAAIAVVGGDADNPCPPCGVCRQALYEFAPRLPVVLLSTGGHEEHRLDELLPRGFGPDSL